MNMSNQVFRARKQSKRHEWMWVVMVNLIVIPSVVWTGNRQKVHPQINQSAPLVQCFTTVCLSSLNRFRWSCWELTWSERLYMRDIRYNISVMREIFSASLKYHSAYVLISIQRMHRKSDDLLYVRILGTIFLLVRFNTFHEKSLYKKQQQKSGKPLVLILLTHYVFLFFFVCFPEAQHQRLTFDS